MMYISVDVFGTYVYDVSYAMVLIILANILGCEASSVK
jgi:hypothetical protein